MPRQTTQRQRRPAHSGSRSTRCDAGTAAGKIRVERDASNRRVVPACGDRAAPRGRGLGDSARNRFAGVVRAVEVDGLLARSRSTSRSPHDWSRSSRATRPSSSGSSPDERGRGRQGDVGDGRALRNGVFVALGLARGRRRLRGGAPAPRRRRGGAPRGARGASLTEVLPRIEPDASYSFGSSSALAEQIRRGAPFDVFLSASPLYTQALLRERLVRKPVPFATNSLVVVVPRSNPAKLRRSSTSRSVRSSGSCRRPEGADRPVHA